MPPKIKENPSDKTSTKRQSSRLNTNQFLALRSIERESWDLKWGRIQWRFNGKWLHLFRRYGVRAPLGSVDGIGGRCGYEDVFERALDAAWELEARGMVEVFTARCCPGSSCHANDRHEFRLTPMGSALLQKANATSLRANVDKKSATEGTPVLEETPNTQASWWHRAVLLLPWRRTT